MADQKITEELMRLLKQVGLDGEAGGVFMSKYDGDVLHGGGRFIHQPDDEGTEVPGVPDEMEMSEQQERRNEGR